MKEKGNKDKFNSQKIIGENIQKIRKERKLTQEQLAEKLNKSVNFISLLERGESGISMVGIAEICNVLDVDANSIYAGLLNYKLDNNDKYILENISIFSEKDKEIVLNLIKYIIEEKEC